MNTADNTPDRWVIVERDGWLSVFAMWCGGYLSGDSWRLSSRISVIEDNDDHWMFVTLSGSSYKCFKTAQGVTAYGAGVMMHYELEPQKFTGFAA